MYPKIYSCDPSALRRVIAFGGTADIFVFFKVGCWRKKNAAIHGTSLAVSIVISSTGWSLTLAGTRTRLEVVFNAVGCFGYLLNEAWKAIKRCSWLIAPQNCVMPDESFIWLVTRVTCVAWGARGSEDRMFRRCLRFSLLHFLDTDDLFAAMLACSVTVTAVGLSRRSSTVWLAPLSEKHSRNSIRKTYSLSLLFPSAVGGSSCGLSYPPFYQSELLSGVCQTGVGLPLTGWSVSTTGVGLPFTG